jgi:DNA-directed RNA polymerase specialized sigma24 family protein
MVTSLATRKKDWILTKAAFEQLLALLDVDREVAGQKYENVRRKLIEFFEARGSHSPASHADETINRVARKLEEGERVQDFNRYFYGVARLLLKEIHRARDKQPIELDLAPPRSVATDNEDQLERRRAEELRLKCFEACLSKLPAIHRLIILQYYREEGVKIEQRKQQAKDLNMSLNALRLRASRIRSELGDCVQSCMEASEETQKQPFVTD